MSDQLLWKNVLAELELEVSSAVFNTMFRQTSLRDHSDGVVTIACMSPMIANLIETRYYTLVKRALNRKFEKDVSVVFTVDTTLRKGSGQKINLDDAPLFQANNNFSFLVKKHGLRSDFTFETFAISSTNQLATAAASHVAKNIGNSYNPLFIYGGVGVGKTHLMHAIAYAILQKDQTAPIVLCTGEEFTNEIIEAIRTKTASSFRNKFRKAQLLCIDDIQFIAGRDSVQEEFFHTFNAVLQSGGQIVLTSDKPPSEIPKLESRIASRLEGGLLVDIAPPNFELRVAIFLIKAKAKNIDFPISLAKIIAANITDTRKLEGILTRILTETEVHNSPFSENLVLNVLGKKHNGQNGQTGEATQERPTKDSVVDAVCSYFQIKSTQLKGKRRDQSVVLPRQILMYLLRTELGVGLKEIGFLIGGRDHTTIMHGVEKISEILPTSEKIRVDIEGIKKQMYG